MTLAPCLCVCIFWKGETQNCESNSVESQVTIGPRVRPAASSPASSFAVSFPKPKRKNIFIFGRQLWKFRFSHHPTRVHFGSLVKQKSSNQKRNIQQQQRWWFIRPAAGSDLYKFPSRKHSKAVWKKFQKKKKGRKYEKFSLWFFNCDHSSFFPAIGRRLVVRKKATSSEWEMASPLIIHAHRWCFLLLISFVLVNASLPTSPSNNNVTCSSVRSAYRARGLPDRDVPQSNLPIPAGK